MSDTFKDLITRPGFTAGWLLNERGGDYHRVLGHSHDEFLAEDASRILASLPRYATTASLREIAKDRHVLTFPDQSRAAQEEACRNWIPAHKDAGLATGILQQCQALWAPDAPTMRLVEGQSGRAVWSTQYGDDDLLSIDVGRGSAPTSPFWGSPTQVPSNWDWDSQWTLGLLEPPTIHRGFIIVYAPPGLAMYGPNGGSGPESMGSPDITVQFGRNMVGMANYWKQAGFSIWGWILAFDHDSFDPMNDNTGVPGGYPDGSWFRAYIPGVGFNRLQTARYYELQDPLV